jgi:ribonucleoside-diphosphate reductase beta chain
VDTKLYNTEQLNQAKEPLFFGKHKNTQRFDEMKYSFLDTNNDNQLARYWRPQEFSFAKDKVDIAGMKEDSAELFMMTTNLQKLIFLDSLQGRSPFSTFAQITTLPEFENVILTWTFFEGSIHSRSYSWALENAYSNPKKVFEDTFKIPVLMKHAEEISKPYNDLYEMVIEYQYMNLKNIEISDEFMLKIRKQIVLAFVNVNILEGIRFYAGFISQWVLTEAQGLVPGMSKTLKSICRDENQHLALTQKVLQYLRKNTDEGFTEIYKELEPQIIEMYKKAVEQEEEWIDYIFSKGSVIGLNDVILKDYIKYITNTRMKAIGLKSLFSGYTKNPIPWSEHWINESSLEGTPMEQEITDYVSGSIDMQDEIDFSQYTL